MTHENRKQALWLARGEALGRWLSETCVRIARAIDRHRRGTRASRWNDVLAQRSNRG